MSDFCFEIENPSNASSIQILDPDGNPSVNRVIGIMNFMIEFRQDVADPWSTAGNVAFNMETDAGGFLLDNDGLYCADFGGTITDVSQIRLSIDVNAGEWNAAGLEAWSLDLSLIHI